MTDRRILRRAQWGTLAAGSVISLAVGLSGEQQLGRGIAVGAAWSALNLRVLEGLLSVVIVPPGQEKQNGRVFLWSMAKLGIYVVAIWLLIVAPIPVIGMAAGLTIMLVTIVVAGVATRSMSETDDHSGSSPKR